MQDEQKPGELADKLVGDIKKDFTIVGTNRVHPWFAWAIVGIVFGMALGIVYVADLSGQFDTGNAQMSQVPSQNQVFQIVAPARLSHITTNPRLTIAFNPAMMPRGAEFSFAYAKANPRGQAMTSFEPLMVDQYRSVYDPEHATYVASNFADLAPGMYLVRASFNPPQLNNYSEVLLIKDPNPKTATAGACFCQKIEVIDDGAAGGSHNLHVIATLDDGSVAASCTEYQEIKSTITATQNDESTSLYSTDNGVNAFMTQEQVNSENAWGGGPTIKTFPYEGSDYASDDFKSPSDASGGSVAEKIHGLNKIEWWDAPGFNLPSLPAALLQPGVELKFEADLQHVVENCKCVTGVHITVKDGVVTENKLDPICQ